jgi:hypothetical protein
MSFDRTSAYGASVILDACGIKDRLERDDLLYEMQAMSGDSMTHLYILSRVIQHLNSKIDRLENRVAANEEG